MHKEATNKKLIPALRFPEFNNAGEWNMELFDEIYSFNVTNSFSRDDLNYSGGSVKNIHYGDIHTKFSTLFDITKEDVPYINSSVSIEKIKPESYCKEGDMIFADASEDVQDVGKSIEIINLNDEKLLSGLHTLLARQKEPKLVLGFGGYLFKSNGIRTQIQKESQGAKVLGISGTRLSNISVYYPDSKKEQQKIAECLSSLDELIDAENQRLDALKEHKKGIMQQLFPADGEKLPKLRFAGFDGEWEVKMLDNLGKFTGGGTPSRNNDSYWQGNIPWISSSDIPEDSITQINISRFITEEALEDSATKLVPENSILLVSRVGVGKLAITRKPVCTSQDFTNFTPNKDDLTFLAYYLKFLSKKLFEFSQGMAIKGFTKDDVSKLTLFLPTLTEQQKIADCLSAIDELITTQTQKIEQLKEHKKGLMQQLFPSPNE